MIYQLSLVIEIARNEFLDDIGQLEPESTNFQMAPYLFHDDCNIAIIKNSGRPFIVKHMHDREIVFSEFSEMIESTYTQQSQDILELASFSTCIVKKHKYITIANIKVGTRERDTPKNGKSKACRDADIEIKTNSTPTVTKTGIEGCEMPQFGTVLDIYSVQPFMNTNNMKEKTYFFLKVLKFSTVGHHRSLWYVDRAADNEIIFIQPKDVHQVQVMMAKHGELDERFDVVVARLGRAPILNAPLIA